MRKPIALIAALALALPIGGAIAATSASAEGANFSMAITTSPVLTTSTLSFGGVKLPAWILTDVTVTVAGSTVSVLSSCSGVELESSAWNCAYTPASGFPVSTGNVITVYDTNPGPNALPHTAAFDVQAAPDPEPEPDPEPTGTRPDFNALPSVSYATTPGTIELTGGYQGQADAGETLLYDGTGALADTCTWSVSPTVCTFSALAAGPWQLVSSQTWADDPDAPATTVDDYLVVPPAPGILTAEQSVDALTVELTGTGIATDLVTVFDETDSAVCSVTVDSAGEWACTTPAFAVGSHAFTAIEQDVSAGAAWAIAGSTYVAGGISPVSEATSIVLSIPTLPTLPEETPTPTPSPTPSAPAPTPTPGPTQSRFTPTWSFDIVGVDPANAHPGDPFTVVGNSNAPTGSVVSVELHSVTVALGQAVVHSNGSFSLDGVIPADTEPGAHHIVVTLAGDGIATTTNEEPVTVVAAPELDTLSVPPVEDAEPAELAEAGEHTADEHDAATEPNLLTDSIDTIADVLAHPEKISSAFAAGIVLLLLAILPAYLLNATIAEQYQRLTSRLPRLRTQPKWLQALRAALNRAPVLGGIAVTAATAFLFGLADPDFGFSLATLRLFLAVAIALFIVTYVANAITAAIVRRRWSIDMVLSIRPLGLVLTVIGVIVSRALHFSPGFLIGLVIGLSIASRSAAQQAWKAVLVRSGILLSMALVAWVVYSSLTGQAGEHGEHGEESFGTEVFLEALVAVMTEGMIVLLIELLPFRLLEGERLFKHSKAMWAGAYLAVLVTFMVAVVPWEGHWLTVGGALWTWIAIVGVFGATCVGIYLYFRFWAPPYEEKEDEDAHERVDIGNTR